MTMPPGTSLTNLGPGHAPLDLTSSQSLLPPPVRGMPAAR
jgi:hypothetical protein